jgi:hypothetical protein
VYDEETVQVIVGKDEIAPFPVWPENEEPISLAFQCHWERQIGFGGRDWQGVRSQEIEAVMRAHRIPPAERRGLQRQVRRFIQVACGELNRIEAERAEEAREK